MNRVEWLSDEIDWTFVDVQGFKTSGNTFVVKEFCLLQKDFKFHAVVKSPCMLNEMQTTWRREAQWLYHVYHGLPFNAGTMSIAELAKHTLERIDRKSTAAVVVVIVKGAEKIQWVRDIYKNHCNTFIDCVNIEGFDCEFRFAPQTRREIYANCPHHRFHQEGNYHCALLQARQLQKHHTNEVTICKKLLCLK